MAKPLSIQRGLSFNGKLMYVPREIMLMSCNSEERRKLCRLFDERSDITFNTGLFDFYGEEIYTGDFVSRENDVFANEYIVRNYIDDDGEPEPYFFIDRIYYDDDDIDRCDPHYERIKFNRVNAARYIVQHNIYHTFEMEE